MSKCCDPNASLCRLVALYGLVMVGVSVLGGDHSGLGMIFPNQCRHNADGLTVTALFQTQGKESENVPIMENTRLEGFTCLPW